MNTVAAPTRSPLARFATRPWIWSFIGALAVWVATIVFTGGKGAGEILSVALTFSSFFVIVGVGQMFVITTGPGNVDLSIPANIALSGALAMILMDGSNGMILAGLVAAVLCGVAIGCFNYILIRTLQIPPIIATLSASFIIQSIAIAYGRGLKIKPPPLLTDLVQAHILSVPLLALFVLALSVGLAFVLNRTLYGRAVTAVGQNPRAAELAGISVGRTRFLTYVLSAALAGLCGAMLAAFSGGASLNMGEEYLLASIAVVVIGGSSVAGGDSNVPGIWGASLFMYLLVTMLNTFGVGAGVRLVATGVIIIAVITIAGGKSSGRG
ncbi:ABC transporter permease [Chthonobacter albigriseus]|uniref:ABC transporter permease n=1 Tax=Chthonobacter albigriseus TaxID=1683161 RepID=UPI0015EF88E1|nr:ABC transporter permease [Chthonobacter albigriseus]